MSTKQKLIIGSRGSMLALWQSNYIKSTLEELNPGLEVEIIVIKTQGDIIQNVALSKIGDKGLFTKELELALCNGEVDLCVHSMKDLPTVLPEGLVIGPVPERVLAYDALVAPAGVKSLDDLGQGARIGTGSLRRRAQLNALGKGFELVQLRGNLDTRIRKVEEGHLDAAILAAAGILRLGWEERIAAVLPPDIMTPAVAQGALALEMRLDDEATLELCSALADADTERCVLAERHVMRVLEGGCQVPIGAHACLEEGCLKMAAMVAELDGGRVIRAAAEGQPEDSMQIADQIVSDLLAQGARAILDAAREQAGEDGSVVPLY
ncbi:MAG: hydroxymethylbilane synthase [Coriobacteriales bacterium]|jgi:hydroxymethylbilane synthase|nr:hydroxymethylbilane synthase [Coriobacteriales bacterium]